MSRAGKTILIMLLAVAGLSIAVSLRDYVDCFQEPVLVIYVQDPNYIQPPCEAQRRLKEQGFYHGKIDNIWGPESDEAFCNWCAVQTFDPNFYRR
jgi:hypothetical protein